MAVVYVVAFGQRVVTAPQPLAVHDVTDIYYLLDARLTELPQKLDALTAASACTKDCAQRWEYSLVFGPAGPAEDRTQFLNLRGEQGWELVNAIWSQDEYAWHYIFKRPLD